MHFAEQQVHAWCHTILRNSQADQTEVLFLGKESALTRFAGNVIHQNVVESNVEVRVRAVVGKRIGTASTNQLDQDS